MFICLHYLNYKRQASEKWDALLGSHIHENSFSCEGVKKQQKKKKKKLAVQNVTSCTISFKQQNAHMISKLGFYKFGIPLARQYF